MSIFDARDEHRPAEDTLDLFVLSDYLSEEAEAAASWITRRFGKKGVEITRHRAILEEEKLRSVLRQARREDAVVIHCFLSGRLRSFIREQCRVIGIDQFDVFSPLLSGLGQASGREPKEDPKLLHPMDREYFKRIRAMEYTIAADDGGNPSILKEADVVILGVSRTGKSPLCVYLANRGVKAANVPLVPEMDLPPQLLRIPPCRIIGLTRSPGSLGEIRSRRMSMMGLAPGESSYVQNDRISREISYASCIMENLGIVVFDVTTRAIEETANEILALLQNMDQTQS